MTKRTKAERAVQIERLREIFKPGDTVTTVLRHVSKSGMSRSVSVAIADQDTPRGIRDISYAVAVALDYNLDAKHGGLKVSGCGFDAGFEIVYNLGLTLWPNGTPEPHGRRNGEPDSNGGYALKHQWL